MPEEDQIVLKISRTQAQQKLEEQIIQGTEVYDEFYSLQNSPYFTPTDRPSPALKLRFNAWLKQVQNILIEISDSKSIITFDQLAENPNIYLYLQKIQSDLTNIYKLFEDIGDEKFFCDKKSYNILYRFNGYNDNIFEYSFKETLFFVNCYKSKGQHTINGSTMHFKNIDFIKIYESHTFISNSVKIKNQTSSIYTSYLGEAILRQYGKDVTNDFLEPTHAQTTQPMTNNNDSPQTFDYAIITALYEDELDFVEKQIIANAENDTSDTTQVVKFGTLKTDTTKKIVYTSLINTGMIDSCCCRI